MAGFAFVGKAVLFSFINLIYTLRAQRRLCARGRSVRRGGPFWRAGRAVLQRKTAHITFFFECQRVTQTTNHWPATPQKHCRPISETGRCGRPYAQPPATIHLVSNANLAFFKPSVVAVSVTFPASRLERSITVALPLYSLRLLPTVSSSLVMFPMYTWLGA